MENGDIVAGERDCAFTGAAQGNHQSGHCGGMMLQQRDGHGLQSWPQQFIRLVGGYRRPAPVPTVPAPS